MFTGLVQSVGDVVAVRPADRSRTLVVRTALEQADLKLGASVSVAGVCLTVTQGTDDGFEAQAAFETLSVTTLGDLVPGSRVNLEPSLRVGDPLGGHLVSGHVDGVGTVRSVTAQGEARELWFEVPSELARFIATKGSVAVEGVSLTVNAVDATGFSVGLIPHTLTVTTLGELAAGGRVNVEVDVVARYVARLMGAGSEGGVTRELLVDAGFIAGAGS